MTAATIVPLAELEEAIRIVFQSLREDKLSEFSLQNDYFWDIPASEIFDLTATPSELSLGQLSDSWEFLRRATAEDDVQVPHTLIWIADILRAAAIEKINGIAAVSPR